MSERPTNSSTYQPSSRWEKKYIISKANGQPVDPKAEYLVLRLDTDTHARTAALAWRLLSKPKPQRWQQMYVTG